VQQPRLVACDVDGTLLDSTARVSRRTAATVRRVVAAGVPFVLVTGRPPRWVPPVVDDLGHAERLEVAIPGCQLAVERPPSIEQQSFVVELDYEHPWAGSQGLTVTRDELLGHEAVKLLVRHSELGSEAMARAAGALIGDAACITFSTGDGLIELSAPGVTKGTGLASLAGRLGVDAADVIAFGDMPNDLPMLSWAGHGVAMANAHPAVLDAAAEVTAPNSEDGVALVLERWF
jgi:hydroxymethylpyrimidine pyrophosphatase-like HAD family hydrolase